MAKNQITGGAFQDFQGNTLSFGYLTMQLSHDEQEAVDPGQVVSGFPIRVPLDANGNVAGTVTVWPNDQLTPSNSYYIVNAYRSDGTLASGSPQYQTVLSSPSPYNIGVWLPNTPPPTGGGSSSSSATADFFIGQGHLQLGVSQTGAVMAANNNEVRVYKFSLPLQVTVSHVSFRLNASSGTPTVAVGIYSDSGSALITTSWTVSGTQVNTNTISPSVVLPPGTYYLAQATSDATNTQVYGDTGIATQQLAVLNASAVKYGTAANAMAGGVLPATLGTVTADNSTWYQPIGALFN